MIYWVDLDVPGRLGVGPRPRCQDDLADVDLVVSLVTDAEREELGWGWLEAVRQPLEDRGHVVQVVALVAERLTAGARVLVHCRAGIGRSGLIAGCVLARLGVRPAAVILDRVSRARGVAVPDTEAQAEWLARYVASLDAPPSLDEALRRLLQ